jgi:hypothetical protein
LRAGQGYVRCGRCANVFNALIALREGEPGGSTTDTAKRRLLETEPKPPVEPALGSGVAMDPEPEPEPESLPEPEPEPELEPEPEAPVSEEESLEFDAIATDVSEIFVSPPEAEHDTGSGTFEEVVLSEEPQPEAEAELVLEAEPDPEPEPEPESETEPEFESPEFSHTDTIAASEWSLLDDPPADDESIIEESPLIQEEAPIEAPVETPNVPDPPWVEEMFAEAEADAERARTSEYETLEQEPIVDEPEMVQVARASTGAAAPSDTVLEPLLTAPVTSRPAWQYTGGVVLLALVLLAQILHLNRQNLVLNTTFGPAVVKVYGWFGATLIPRWDLTAYTVTQLGAEAEGSDGNRLRVRLSVQNESSRVQPLPLLRLTLQDRFGNAVATRDLEPAEYLPKRAADQRLLEPDQRIDTELHVIDPGKAAIGFEIDACLRGEGGAIGCANDARRHAAG